MPWRSSGWNDNRNLPRLLNLMVERGEVVAVGRRGREPIWDLAARVYPDDPVPDVEDARRIRDQRELRALGIVRRSTAGEPARVDGVRGTWRVDPALLDAGPAGRTALLSPFDRLLFHPKRLAPPFRFGHPPQ